MRPPFEFMTLVSVYDGDINAQENFDEDSPKLNITTLEFPVFEINLVLISEGLKTFGNN